MTAPEEVTKRSRGEREIVAGEPLLRVTDVRKYFPLRGKFPLVKSNNAVRAVDGVSLDLAAGDTLAIVGESGSGKTTLARVVLRLEHPTAGRLEFDGVDISDRQSWKRGSPIQAVFQDPRSSLNPRMRVGQIVAEPLSIAGGMTRRAARARVLELLDFVGVESAAVSRYPHEFSGGQRQRIAIARALSSGPRLIVLDEPLSALDVSIRAQVINLLVDVQAEFGCSYLMIAHDLASVRVLSHDVAVMYLGKIVERAPAESLFTAPRHPYTQALLSASLPLRPGTVINRMKLTGEIPSPANPPSGCRFRTRCPLAFDRCAVDEPQPWVVAPGHEVACHLFDPNSVEQQTAVEIRS